MFVVICLDTSASMNQKTSSGLSLLDAAKAAVEHFLRLRSKDPLSQRTDKYLLVTTSDGEAQLRVGLKDPITKIGEVVKTVQARGLTAIGAALRLAFDTLNLYRLSQDVEMYGQGRAPWYIPHYACIWLLTDGGQLTKQAGVEESLILPESNCVGAELTIEPFRWDQRLFVTYLRFPGIGTTPTILPSERDPGLEAMIENTGGRAYTASSMKTLLQSVEAATGRMSMPAVVVRFQCVNFTPMLSMLYVRSGQGWWFIPEGYWPVEGMTSIPPRPAHPLLKMEVGAEPTIEFPCDKFEIESNSFTQHVLRMGLKPGVVLLCLSTARRSGTGHSHATFDPYGFVKPSGNQVFLYLLPFNFPRLLKLVDEYKLRHMTTAWRQEYENYCRSIPGYYLPNLRGALKQLGISVPAPTSHDMIVPQSLGLAITKVVAQAKAEEQWQQVVAAKKSGGSTPGLDKSTANGDDFRSVLSKSSASSGSDIRSSKYEELNKSYYYKESSDGSASSSSPFALDMMEVSSVGSNNSANLNSSSSDHVGVVNAFDIPKFDLLNQLQKIRKRATFRSPAALPSASSLSTNRRSIDWSLGSYLQNDHNNSNNLNNNDVYQRHHVPIAQMGNFMEVLRKMEIPRDPFADDDNANRLTFSNPWIRNPKTKMSPNADGLLGADEADEAVQTRRKGSHVKSKIVLRLEASGATTATTSNNNNNNNNTTNNNGNVALGTPILSSLSSSSSPSSPSSSSAQSSPATLTMPLSPIEIKRSSSNSNLLSSPTASSLGKGIIVSTPLATKLSLVRMVRSTKDEAKIIGAISSSTELDNFSRRVLLKELEVVARAHRRHKLAALIASL